MKRFRFALKTSGLKLISSIRLDGRKAIQFMKAAWSILHSELNTNVLPLLEKNNRGPKAMTGRKRSTTMMDFKISCQ